MDWSQFFSRPIFPDVAPPGEAGASPFPGLAASVLKPLAVPGQVYNSPEPLTSDQMVAPATQLASMLTLGAGAIPAEANAFRSGMSLFDRVSEKYPTVKLDGYVSPSGQATLSRVVVPEELRNQGIGSQVMRDLTAEADKEGLSMALSPSSDFGGNKSRLTDFYKRFGFVSNSGRNKDFTTRETMVRAPNKVGE